MSKKRPTESSWDSDEELLSDTSGITAFPKTTELDLLGDDGELDEDALLGMDETGTETVSVSFANDSVRPIVGRQRSKTTVSHQEESVVDEQAFVFEETDTADLEDELNVGVQEDDPSAYQNEDGTYSSGIYHQEGAGDASQEHGDYTSQGSEAYDQTHYTDDNAVLYDAGNAGYMGDQHHEENNGVELGYEQPLEQDGQVLLEYGDGQTSGELASEEKDAGHYESESDSDDDSSRHSRGKFTSERTGVISLTPATTRETIPDTLEINDEQAAQIEQFMTDKPPKQKGKGPRGQERPSAHSRLGNKQRSGSQGNAGLLQGPRMGAGPLPRGMPNHPFRMGFPFAGGTQNRGPFPGGLMNPRSPFPLRLMNQRGLFPGVPPNHRGPFLGGPESPRNFGPQGPGGPQRGPFPPNQQNRFPGNQRGPFPEGILNQGQLRMLQQMQGPRQQGQMSQRGPNLAQFRQRSAQMGQGMRMTGPGGSGPRPLMGPGGPLMRPPPGQPIPSLVKPLMGQQPRKGAPNSAPPQGRIPPHQRLGPMQKQNRFQQSPNQPGGPNRLMVRAPNMGQGAQPPLGDAQSVRKHKIYINPKFQGSQTAPGPSTATRTVKMGVPVQQKKAKALLDRAIQIKNKPGTAPVQTALAPVKRKSTGGEEPPVKVTKMDGKASTKPNEEPSRVVQTSNASTDAESERLKALLEEQKRKREMIQKKKELARQKQAEVKRKELEKRLKEEGKTLNDILGHHPETENKEDKEQVIPVKEISGSVAARLGPPPTQKIVRGPVPQQQQQQQQQQMGQIPPQMGSAILQRMPGPQRPQQFQRTPQQVQNIRVQAPSLTTQLPPNQSMGIRVSVPSNEARFVVQNLNAQARMAGAPTGVQQFRTPPPTMDVRFRSPVPTSDPRLRGPVMNVETRFRGPPSVSDPRLRGPPPRADPRLRTPTAASDSRLRGPPPHVDPKLRGPQLMSQFRTPPPASDARLRGPATQDLRYRTPPPQAGPQSPQVQTVRYTVPVPTTPQTVRFHPPHSAPPTATPPAQHQQYPPQYPPPQSAPAMAQPSHQYVHMPPAEPANVHHYTPQTASYQPPTYPPPSHSQSLQQPVSHHPPHSAPQYIQTPTPAPSTQFQTPPQHYQTPPTAPQYQSPPAHQFTATTPQYQTPSPQYHTPPTHQYTATPQSYEVQSDQRHQHYDYYNEPQPIQTITSQQTSKPSSAQDQRTVQHHSSPVGQRIQTIGQRVQPVTGTQMRSIIHNVVSPRSSSAAAAPSRMVQTRVPGSAGNRSGNDGQVAVLDGPQKILIQNVPQMATKETLIKICRHFGQVLGVNLMREQNKAVVQFQKGEQAAKCVAKCDQKCLHKVRLTVKLLPG